MGIEFRLGLVKQVVGKLDAELQRMLSDLQLGEFIYEQPAFPDVEYTFKHALTQEVAYNSVLVERRRVLHRRTGAAIEALYRDRLEDHYANLASHYRHSDDVAKAVEYLRLASEQAVERSAYLEAAADLKAAIALVGGLPEGTDRLRVELALHITEGSVATVLHGIGSQERERAFERVCEIGERLGDTTSLLRGSIFLSFLYIARGEPVRAREICSRHLELAEQSGVVEILAPAHWIIELATLFSGDLNETRRLSHEWRERFEAATSRGVPHQPAGDNLATLLLRSSSSGLDFGGVKTRSGIPRPRPSPQPSIHSRHGTDSRRLAISGAA